MRGSAARYVRRQANDAAGAAAQALTPPIAAALANEQKLRRRVDAVEALVGRNLRGRLRWLLTGK